MWIRKNMDFYVYISVFICACVSACMHVLCMNKNINDIHTPWKGVRYLFHKTVFIHSFKRTNTHTIPSIQGPGTVGSNQLISASVCLIQHVQSAAEAAGEMKLSDWLLSLANLWFYWFHAVANSLIFNFYIFSLFIPQIKDYRWTTSVQSKAK